MKFVILMTGKGPGCDYTIDCNKHFEVFESPSIRQAVEKAKELSFDYGGIKTLENVQLFEVGLSFTIPLENKPNELEFKETNLNPMFSG